MRLTSWLRWPLAAVVLLGLVMTLLWQRGTIRQESAALERLNGENAALKARLENARRQAGLPPPAAPLAAGERAAGAECPASGASACERVAPRRRRSATGTRYGRPSRHVGRGRL